MSRRVPEDDDDAVGGMHDFVDNGYDAVGVVVVVVIAGTVSKRHEAGASFDSWDGECMVVVIVVVQCQSHVGKMSWSPSSSRLESGSPS